MLYYQGLCITSFFLCIISILKFEKEFLIDERKELLDNSYGYFWSGIVFLNCIILLILTS
jgi:hypothetical protein